MAKKLPTIFKSKWLCTRNITKCSFHCTSGQSLCLYISACILPLHLSGPVASKFTSYNFNWQSSVESIFLGQSITKRGLSHTFCIF